MHCPACHSPNVRSNRIADTTIGRFTHAAQWGRLRGNTRFATVALAAAGAMHGINRLRLPWKCGDCKATFGDEAAVVADA